MLSEIQNKNIKSLIRKLEKYPEFDDAPRNLCDNLLNELRFARLIVPAFDVSDETFKIKYFKFTQNYDDLYVYTDMAQFKHSQSKEFVPMEYELLDFGNTIYSNIANLVINDSYKVPMQRIWDTLEKENSHEFFIEEFSHDYTVDELLNLIDSFDNEKLIEYVNERKRIQSYPLLFHLLGDSVVFADIEVIDGTDSILVSREVESYHCIDEDNCIVTYTNLDSFNQQYFSVVDWFELIGFAIYYQLDGIKIRTDKNVVKLSRNQLLKHFDSIRKSNYSKNLTNAFRYIFRVDDYAKKY